MVGLRPFTTHAPHPFKLPQSRCPSPNLHLWLVIILTFENIRSLIPARQISMFVDRALCNVSQLQEIVIFQKKVGSGYKKPFKNHDKIPKRKASINDEY